MLKRKIAKLIAPSILSANFANLEKDIHEVEKAGADFLHVDVMDGHFVPNLTIGAPVVKDIRKVTRLVIDTHLMITEPERFVEDFAKAGSDYITFHVEASKAPQSLIEKIRGLGVKPGLSLRPGTHLNEIIKFLPLIDLVLVMSVEPGFGGQSFMEDQLTKVRELDNLRKKHNFTYLISIDGGINAETAKAASEAGADIFVAGSYIFENDIAKSIHILKEVT